MEPLISIIVPVYNTGSLINKCLDSVIEQTYKNWNCIIVDDGSTDGTGQLCDEYAEKDSRLQVYHIDNCGSGMAKNYGIRKSNAEFIAFLDSDDWIDREYLSFLASRVTNNIDMIMCHAVFEYTASSVEVLKVSPDLIESSKREKRDYILSSINRGYAKNILKEEQGFLNTVWGKIYRTDVIRKNNIEFSGLALNEDNIFNLYFFQAARGFEIHNRILYHYRMRETSAVHSFRENYKDVYIDYLNQVKEFITKYYSLEGDFRKSYYSLVITSLFNITKDYFYNPDFPDKNKRSEGIKEISCMPPFAEALEEFDYNLAKNREVLLIAISIRHRLYFLLDLYFGLRPQLKSLLIRFFKKRIRDK